VQWPLAAQCAFAVAQQLRVVDDDLAVRAGAAAHLGRRAAGDDDLVQCRGGIGAPAGTEGVCALARWAAHNASQSARGTNAGCIGGAVSRRGSWSAHAHVHVCQRQMEGPGPQIWRPGPLGLGDSSVQRAS
jgi:hypothetical protein